MGYITINLSRDVLTNGGQWVDQGVEQHKERQTAIAVTLHEEDLRRGTFVIALVADNGLLTPFTWKSDAGSHQAVVQADGVMEGGTLQQFTLRCEQQARFAQVHGWAPSVRHHVPRSYD